jgi:hypothetical protein
VAAVIGWRGHLRHGGDRVRPVEAGNQVEFKVSGGVVTILPKLVALRDARWRAAEVV